MHLFMAVGVYQGAVLCFIAATFRLVDDMVVVPTGIFRNWLVAHRAETFLVLP